MRYLDFRIRALSARRKGIKGKHIGTGRNTLAKNCRTVGCTFEPCRVHASATTTYDGAVNANAFFLTNSCKLSGLCPVSVSTSPDIRS
jgi:hypothetical protein